MADISSNFLGIHSPNPFWLASAPPTDKKYNVLRAFEAGWGGVVWKTLGSQVKNVSSRYSAVDYHGGRVMGFNNIELISDRPLDINLKEIKSDVARKKACDITKGQFEKLKKLNVTDEIRQACEYSLRFKLINDNSFLEDEEDSIAAILAQTMTAADHFEFMLSKDADTEVDAARALDILYLLSKKNRFKKAVIDALALWLDKEEVFRFYKTLER